MDLPKGFQPEGIKEEDVRKLLKEPGPERLQAMLKSSKEFLKKHHLYDDLDELYGFGADLASDLKYDLNDLRSFIEKLKIRKDEDRYIGFYISSLLNKVTPEGDRLTLKLGRELHGIGAYLKKDVTLIVEGDVGDCAGYNMNGYLMINGNARDCTGNAMLGVMLVVEGNVRDYLAIHMKGGSIIVKENSGNNIGHCMGLGSGNPLVNICKKMGTIREDTCRGAVYHKEVLVWPEIY